MTTRFLGSALLTVVFVIASAPGAGLSAAQEKPAAPEWPRRTSDGQPDIQGVWGSVEGTFTLHIEAAAHLQTLGIPKRELSGQSPSGTVTPKATRQTIVVDPATGILPHQPWALERRNSVMKDFTRPAPWQLDPQARSWPNGVPRLHIYSSGNGSIGGPWQILQGSGYVLFLYEVQHEFRYLPLDGRPQPGSDIKLWMGSSRGRWEGNTLVVDATNHNDSTRFDVIGDFHSDEMRVTERFTFVDNDTLEYRATIEDPKVYAKPWTIAITNKRAEPGAELFEYAGVEGETDAAVVTEKALQREREAGPPR